MDAKFLKQYVEWYEGVDSFIKGTTIDASFYYNATACLYQLNYVLRFRLKSVPVSEAQMYDIKFKARIITSKDPCCHYSSQFAVQ